MKKENRAIIIFTILGIITFIIYLIILGLLVKEIKNTAEEQINLIDYDSILVIRYFKELDKLTEYCTWDESRGRMDVIGAQGEIGILQFKKATWDLFEKRYNFNGDIYNCENQIKLFRIAIANGECRHWTCCRKYNQYGLSKSW